MDTAVQKHPEQANLLNATLYSSASLVSRVVVEGSVIDALTLSTVNSQNRWSGVTMLMFLSGSGTIDVGCTVGEGIMKVGVGSSEP